MNIPKQPGTSKNLWRRLPRAWFYLTPNERLAIAVILGLFLLGLGARWWYLSGERSEDRGQKTEVRRQRSEFRSQRSVIRGRQPILRSSLDAHS